MNTRQEKEKLQKYTIAYLIAMVVVFVVVLIGVRSAGLKTVALIATVVLFAALIFLQWRKTGEKVAVAEQTPPKVENPPLAKTKEEPKAETKTHKTEKEPVTDIATKTGAVCMEPGQYHCSKHPHRTATMEEGKRFPPCRGDKKGHSAIWLLDEE
ncbi:hypothetical protein [Sphaerochaeta sp. PS]|uniref:hypothetical protein n=1 Tax=Sphaerochaeta sp. PS TaxID=3076336 RepID=UPI0028A377D2|nr:hypothetical protein [Sphaerochaeta sp. PS]MDT4761724.1 hypothetical protein [Sphaerochaeta sp. PS]